MNPLRYTDYSTFSVTFVIWECYVWMSKYTSFWARNTTNGAHIYWDSTAFVATRNKKKTYAHTSGKEMWKSEKHTRKKCFNWRRTTFLSRRRWSASKNRITFLLVFCFSLSWINDMVVWVLVLLASWSRCCCFFSWFFFCCAFHFLFKIHFAV